MKTTHILAALLVALPLALLTSCGGTQTEGSGLNLNNGGEGQGTWLPGQDDPKPEEETPEMTAYRLWNDGCGIQPAPTGVPVGYVPVNYTNPVYQANMVPDPSVIRVDGWFYLFATGNNVRMMKSKDLVHWTVISDAFTNAGRPAWNKKPDGSKAGLWAPDINYINGKYVLFYSLAGKDDAGNGYNGIGRAVSGKVEGPYTDLGMLIEPKTYGTQHVIDPFYFEFDRKKYLAWGSFWNIHLTELTDDGLNLKTPGDGTTKSIIHLANNKFEGTMMVKHGGYFYLIGSSGTTLKGYDSTYHLTAGRATTPLGPFYNRNGKKLTDSNVAGTTFLSGVPNKFIGTGHNAEFVTDEAGQTWVLYHAYVYGLSDTRRVLFLDKIIWDEDGWPMVEGGVASASAEAPVF
ncbi:MAG: family 43 glycosylhydrolase [Bacteroidales bacterium]|nr:family 43 glycosylhydrolase [Bacteroidales bacterium]